MTSRSDPFAEQTEDNGHEAARKYMRHRLAVAHDRLDEHAKEIADMQRTIAAMERQMGEVLIALQRAREQFIKIQK